MAASTSSGATRSVALAQETDLGSERDRLIEKHLPLVYALARRVWSRGSSLALEDLAALGSVGLVQAAGRYRPGGPARFGTFAYQRVRGAMYDGMRRVVTHDPCSPTTPDPRNLILRCELAQQIEDAMRDLPEREAELIRLRYFEGKTLKECGDALGVSRSWACRLHARALQSLREFLDVPLGCSSPD